MYKVPIRWYDLILICIGWIPGPDFGGLCMCSSHLKVVKGVMQPRTCNINLASYGQDHADVGAKGGKPVLGPK